MKEKQSKGQKRAIHPLLKRLVLLLLVLAAYFLVNRFLPGQPVAGIAEDGFYTTKEDVALYIHTYGKLPSNFITKAEAEKLGWNGGGLDPFQKNACIGGDRFGNYEELLPTAKGRSYTECDIDTMGASARGAKRIVFSNDGLIYYTGDHYETFELLYGEE